MTYTNPNHSQKQAYPSTAFYRNFFRLAAPALGLLLLSPCALLAETNAQMAKRIVTVCTTDRPGQVTDQARLVASQIFRGIGVKLVWHIDARFCEAHPDQAIVVSYSRNTPKELRPGTFAMALPYEGTHIEIFSDRVGAVGGGVREDLLGHVLAHEITHMLQGSARHSDSGLMKAHWDRAELAQMKVRHFSFTDLDALLIYNGLAARDAAGAAVAAANRVE